MKVLFVCTGNICRSPAAHAVLEHRLAEAAGRGEAWAGRVQVDSVGLGGWHEGELPDPPLAAPEKAGATRWIARRAPSVSPICRLRTGCWPWTTGTCCT